MIEWGQKSKLKKFPGPKFNPQKIEFPSHKNFQRNNVAGIRRNYHNTPKNLLKSSYQKNSCQNFPSQKNCKIKNFKPKKSFDHSCHLKLRVLHPPPRPAWTQSVQHFGMCPIMVTTAFIWKITQFNKCAARYMLTSSEGFHY